MERELNSKLFLSEGFLTIILLGFLKGLLNMMFLKLKLKRNELETRKLLARERILWEERDVVPCAIYFDSHINYRII